MTKLRHWPNGTFPSISGRWSSLLNGIGLPAGHTSLELRHVSEEDESTVLTGSRPAYKPHCSFSSRAKLTFPSFGPCSECLCPSRAVSHARVFSDSAATLSMWTPRTAATVVCSSCASVLESRSRQPDNVPVSFVPVMDTSLQGRRDWVATSMRLLTRAPVLVPGEHEVSSQDLWRTAHSTCVHLQQVHTTVPLIGKRVLRYLGYFWMTA